MTHKRILIVDDEESICSFLKVSLVAHSYQVRTEHNGRSAIQAVIDYRPDLVILDLGLPDMSGHQVLSRIREWSTLPVVVLTVQDSVDDKVKALDQGADDYLTKPFNVSELLARVRVALRHHERKDGSSQFVYKNLEVDLSSHTVKLDGEVISLTITEYDILKVLIKYAGKVVTHRTLLKEVWGPNLVEHTQYLRVYVGHLRKKLKSKSIEDFIVTEPGVGYRFLI